MRRADLRDFAPLMKLWEQAFGDEGGFREEFFKERAPLADILVLEDEGTGEIVSALYLLPCEMRTSGGATVSATNMVGVATDLGHRNKGCMSRLINYAFEYLKEKGVAVVVLKPSAKAFYEQYGFKVCNVLYEFEPDVGEFGLYRGCEKMTDALIERLDAIYKGEGGNVLLRSLADWRFNLKDYAWVAVNEDAYHLCCEKDGVLVARESVPLALAAEQGREVGYTMYKILDDGMVDFLEGVENRIFEQY